MNEIAKKRISELMVDAIFREKIRQSEVAEILGISQAYVSLIKRGNVEYNIPDHIWHKAQEWTNSGLSFREFGKKRGMAVSWTPKPEPEPTPERSPEAKDTIGDVTKHPDTSFEGITEVEFEDPNEEARPQPTREYPVTKDEARPETVREFNQRIKLHLEAVTNKFLKTAYEFRRETLKETIEESLEMNNALSPDVVEQYNEICSWLENYTQQ